MSYPIVIPWLPSTTNKATIAPIQSLAAAGSLALSPNNSALSNSNYVYDRVIRSVSLTSTNNLSGVQFTIRGIGSPVDGVSGNPTQVLGNYAVTINGPNNNTIATTAIFSQISSITTNGAAAAVSAGFGISGITDYVFLDYNRYMFQTSVQLHFNALPLATSLQATVYQSLSKPEYLNNPNVDMGQFTQTAPIPGFAVSANLTNATTNQLGSLQAPVAITWANMSVTGAPGTDSLIFTVEQQGIK
jgi:hypothetical protein